MGLFSSISNFFVRGSGFGSSEYRNYDVSPILWSPFSTTPPLPPIEDNLGDWLGGSLTGRRSNLIYGFMSRDDSQVASDLFLLKTPITGAIYQLDGPVQRVNKFVAEQLGISLEEGTPHNIKWHKLLREMLTAIEHGFSCHEVYYEFDEEQGRDTLGGVDFRWQNTIEKFNADKGVLNSVVQIVKDDSGTPKEVELPRDRLCYYAPWAIGDNWRGMSLLRPAYRPWFAKSQIFYADLLGMRRSLMPLPIGHYSAEESSDTEIRLFERQLSELTSHASSYMLLPDGRMDVQYLQRQSTHEDVLGRQRHYNAEISRALFSHILDLSESQTADRSLSQDLYDILFNALWSIALGVTSAIQSDIIDPLVNMNFGTNAVRPRLVLSNLDTTRIFRIAQHIEMLGRQGFLRPDDRLEDDLRSNMDLPEMDMETLADRPGKMEMDTTDNNMKEGEE